MCPYSKTPRVILWAFSILQGFCGFKKSIDRKIKNVHKNKDLKNGHKFIRFIT
jgi:hypothetical protein